MADGLRGDFTGHRRYLSVTRPCGEAAVSAETVAVVVVTFNRAELLERMLVGLAALERRPDAVPRRRQRQHRRHAPRAGRGDEPGPARPPSRGESSVARAASTWGEDRPRARLRPDRLMDDDVVPASDRPTVLEDQRPA